MGQAYDWHAADLGAEFSKAMTDAGLEIDAERFMAVVRRGGSIIAGKAVYDAIAPLCRRNGIRLEMCSYVEANVMYAIDFSPLFKAFKGR